MPRKMQAEVPAFATFWAQELGCSTSSIALMRGGINNDVFACRSAATSLVIKGYPDLVSGDRCRFQAEVAFLTYANQVAKGFVPSLLHIDASRRCIVMEHLDGRVFSDGCSPSAMQLARAGEFIRRLNSDLGLARASSIGAAAESYATLSGHIANIEARIAKFSSAHLPENLVDAGARLLVRMQRGLDSMREQIGARLRNGDLLDAIEPGTQRLSPSDFGFHNAIDCPGGTRFIDFEFAGWDDPAKAAIDFSLQPRVPVPLILFNLANYFPIEDCYMVETRMSALMEILKLKWACIIGSILALDRFSELATRQELSESVPFIERRIVLASSYVEGA